MNTDGHIDAEMARAFCANSSEPSALPPAGRLAVSDHAAGCAQCRELIAACAKSRTNRPRQRVMRDIRAMADSAQAEGDREQVDLAAFVNAMESFPIEHFTPGGTLPVERPARVPTCEQDAESVRAIDAWWNVLFGRPTAYAAVAAVIAISATVAANSVFRNGASPPVANAAANAPLLRDGPITVSADGTLANASALPDELRKAVAAMIQNRSVHLPAAGLRTFRGDTNDAGTSVVVPPAVVPPNPVEPPMGSVVEDQAPLLQWTRIPDAKGYRVEITTGSNEEITVSSPLASTVTRWRPQIPLERGRIYRWNVQAFGENGSTLAANSPVSLKILGVADEAKIQSLRSGPNVSHLALAAAYNRLNLHSEARHELQILHNQNPGSDLAAALLDSAK